MTALLPGAELHEAPGAARAVALPSPLRDPQPPFRLRASMNGIAEAPGKVWFFELAAAVIDADRCVECGACVAACPTDSIGVSADGIPELVKLCTGCGLCWDFCPRGGLRYETTWLAEPAATASGAGGGATAGDGKGAGDGATASALPARITGGEPGPGLGRVRSAVAARVRPDSRFAAGRAQDGGVVTAVLLAALEAGAIDGAVVAREDPGERWRGVPFVATTPEQLRSAAGSFYNQTMALAALDLEHAGLSAGARVAVVGTPCEVQGIRALQAHSWRRGASRVDAVVLTIALLCTKSFDYRSLLLGELSAKRGVEIDEVGKVDIVHGRFLVEDRSGAVLVDEPVKAFHGAALKGCDECADFLGRAADLSVGSVGSPAGWSSVLARSAAGEAALERLGSDLELAALERPEALRKLDQHDHRVAREALARPLEPAGARFISFDEHCAAYGASERAPLWRGR
ncbi:MAG TPA: Coenzyme F420 hydrogenase/dehydrogenase, beta subunit C-terminal domain [Acidimicrobiales bacterium]|nr:Coenzyme F420 hydrogenase/dehydrogenase, beta subunit C-terminal domain [Acidimicrobiales bacterium]